MEAMAIEGLRLVCCQTGAGVLVVDMNAYLDKARNMAKIVAYQRAQVTPREMEFFKQRRQTLFKQWRFLGCTTVYRDEKGKFIPKGPQDANNNSTIRERSVSIAQKRKRENPYAGVLLA